MPNYCLAYLYLSSSKTIFFLLDGLKQQSIEATHIVLLPTPRLRLYSVAQ